MQKTRGKMGDADMKGRGRKPNEGTKLIDNSRPVANPMTELTRSQFGENKQEHVRCKQCRAKIEWRQNAFCLAPKRKINVFQAREN